MRKWTLALAAAAALVAGGVAAGVEPARAAPVVVFEKGKLRTYEEPALDGRLTRLVSPRSRVRARRGSSRQRSGATATASRARVARADPVRRALRRAHAADRIDAATRRRYLGIYTRALRVRRRLAGTRRAELAYVIRTLAQMARAGRLNAGRMPALFLVLDRNREWWSRRGPPASGARVQFGSSLVIFQYYPGRGLQLQPLANFGKVNGLWQARRDRALRSLVDDLVALRVNRGAFTTWEYYFRFGGGSPPWISGMAQATAMQALARAGKRLKDKRLLEIARRGRGAFERRTPVGVRVPAGSSGAWFALYSFAPRLGVLNAMLQSLIGLNAYRVHTGDERARRLFDAGDRVARARIRKYDTGAWSLYNRPWGRPGAEASLNYHTLNRDFSSRLCKSTRASAYCEAAENFTRYLKEDPELRPYRAVPAPAVGGRGVKFRFRLSKVGRVGIIVRGRTGGAAARTYLSTSAPFRRGDHFFRWVPFKLKRERIYEYRLTARDLAGNTATVKGTIRVKPPRKRRK